MSSTKEDLREKRTLNPLGSFSVAVVEPEFPINLGYVARVMANFGMSRLFVVSNRRLGKEEIQIASKFSSHGSYLIERIIYSKSLRRLRNRFNILVGTTAITAKRKSNITRKTMSVEECARAISKGWTESQKICIVFGRDTTGLTNMELEQCDFTLSIRTGTGYNTLNISHAAAVIFYAFQVELSRIRPTSLLLSSESSRRERERVVSLFEDLAILADFQKYKQGRLEETLHRLINRSNPSLRELYLLMGLASKARSKIKTLESMRLHKR